MTRLHIPFDLNSLIRESTLRSFWSFVQKFWTSTDPSTPRWNWHMEYLCNTLQEDAERILNGHPKQSDIIVNCPPGVSKTMIISVMYPTWLLVSNPKLRIITASYSKTVALEAADKSLQLINSDLFKSVFPDFSLRQDAETKSHYKTQSGGGRLVGSTGANITGMHADIIIGDDLENPTTVNSELQRNTIHRWVSETLSTRKTDKENTLMIFVQQRLHQQDLTSYLLSLGDNYKHIVLPAELSDAVQPEECKEYYVEGLLDPIRLSQKVLDGLKIRLGTRGYNAQIRQTPSEDSESIIRREWLNVILALPELALPEIKKPDYFYVLDTAYGGDGSDYTVILECLINDGILYLTNLYRQRPDFPTLIKDIQVFCRAKQLYIETKASGKSVVQQLRASTNYNVMELTPQGSKIERLNSVAPTIEGGRLCVLQSVWTETLISEVTSNYPVNDDIRDCVVYAVQILENNINDGFEITFL